MNRFNRLPFKERKRQGEYNFNQLERQFKQEKKRMMHEAKRLKISACRELTDKERQEEEAFKRLRDVANMKVEV